ncbi:gametocyte-specific factor 1-like [Limulus polyphemus]|uniref:Gametocyte-specific factor 1-like n=1 Tax=Limulus polyphemus TaxID=6850 RepID=A0ABM1C0S7_LIMPO|nr:gametocyte-specific factor 1-like [Limulus polyphemus]
MATFQTRDDPMVNCPYNKAHRVSRSRIQSHILKCRKTHQDRQLETCPFNAQHRIEKELKHDHIMNCPDRAAVDREIAMSANGKFFPCSL